MLSTRRRTPQTSLVYSSLPQSKEAALITNSSSAKDLCCTRVVPFCFCALGGIWRSYSLRHILLPSSGCVNNIRTLALYASWKSAAQGGSFENLLLRGTLYSSGSLLPKTWAASRLWSVTSVIQTCMFSVNKIWIPRTALCARGDALPGSAVWML